MKVKFNTAVVFGSPAMSVAHGEVVDIDEKVVKPFLESGAAEKVEEEKPKAKRGRKSAKAKEDEESAE